MYNRFAIQELPSPFQKELMKLVYKMIREEDNTLFFAIGHIVEAISKTYIDSLERGIHPEALDEMDDEPMTKRAKEVIAKKKLRKMCVLIRWLWRAKAKEISEKLRILWMNRNNSVSRGNTSAVSDMMLLIMPIPPTAETANCSLLQRGIMNESMA